MNDPYIILSIIGVFVVAVTAFALSRYYEGPPAKPDYTGMVGQVGRAETTVSLEGKVVVRGEIWAAESSTGIIEKGEPVRVIGYRDSMVLIVEKEGEPESSRTV